MSSQSIITQVSRRGFSKYKAAYNARAMKRSRLFNSQRTLIGLIILLLASSLLPARWARVISSQPRHLLQASLAPVDHLLKPLADKLRRPPDLPVDLGNREEYERAKQQIVELQYKLRQATEQIAELSQTRSQLRLVGVQLLPATVTAWSGDRLHPSLMINRGSRHGLRPGLVVARGFSLMGRVTDTGPVTATARLITAPKTYLIVSIRPPATTTEPREILTQVQAAGSGSEFWCETSADDPIQINDLAYLYDDAWPTEARGLVVGKVTRIDPHPDDPILRRRVVIRPIRSLMHLDHVTVIIPIEAPGVR